MKRDKLGRYVKGGIMDITGKTYEEFYGKEKADKIKKTFSLLRKGKPLPKVSIALRKRYAEGMVAGMKGRHLSEEARRKLSENHKGRKLTEEHRRHIATAMGGRAWTDEEVKFLKENFSKRGNIELAKLMNRTPKSIIARAFTLGFKRDKKFVKELRIRSATGREISLEHRQILSELKKKDNPMKRLDVRKKMSESSKGKILSEETKRKIGKHSKEIWQIKEYRNKTIKAQREGMKKTPISPNKPERFLKRIIERNNLPFNFVGDRTIWIGDENHSFNPDFLSKNPKHIIEVFGDYWHNRADIKEKDVRRLATFSKHGYKTLIFWEHELNGRNHNKRLTEQQIVNKISSFIKGRSEGGEY